MVWEARKNGREEKHERKTCNKGELERMTGKGDIKAGNVDREGRQGRKTRRREI
jgi:hypothetical protein